MKFYILSVVVGLSLPLVCCGSVLPRDEPIKPDRPLSATSATRATARFGPFKLPSNKVNGMIGMPGLLIQNVMDVPLPCKSCTYTYVKGDMVYKNGTSANVENGAYMHHITLVSMPPGGFSLQEVLKSIQAISTQLTGGPLDPTALMGSAKPLYLIGNERLPLTFPNAGVYITKNSKTWLSLLLQNLESDEKEVYIDMDYDYLPGQPEGYTDIIPVSQDALGVGAVTGSVKQIGTWTKTSPAYKAIQDSQVLMMYGHVHDGGIHTEIMVNGKVTCDSLAYYQDMVIPANQTTTGALGGHGHAKRDGGNSHILAFGECTDVGMIKKDDEITTKVYYDFTKRPATLMANGKEDALMGISMTYLGIPMKKEA
jgi:hypothetical protein